MSGLAPLTRARVQALCLEHREARVTRPPVAAESSVHTGETRARGRPGMRTGPPLAYPGPSALPERLAQPQINHILISCSFWIFMV